MNDKYTSAAYQDAVRTLVGREVLCCASTLIHDLAQNCEDEYADEIMSVCARYREVPDGLCVRYIVNLDERGEFSATMYQIDDEDPTEERELFTVDTDEAAFLTEEGIDIRDCEAVADYYKQMRGTFDSYPDHYLDADDDVPMTESDDPDEALEHWIVSHWLAEQLEKRGEMVSYDIHGLTIWGRTTSGQAILLDRVICDIYDDLGADWHVAA